MPLPSKRPVGGPISIGATIKRLGLMLLLLASVIAIAACGSSDGGETGATEEGTTPAAEEGTGAETKDASSQSDPITIGFAVSTSGFENQFDGPELATAELARDDINAKGGIDGRQLDFVVSNNKSEAQLSGNGAEKVLEEGAEIIIVSGNFTIGAGAAIVAEENGVLSISPGGASTSFGPEGVGPLSFSMASPAGAFGSTIAEWAYQEKGIRSAYALTDDTLQFTKQNAFGFKTRWEEIGGKFLGESIFKQEDPSISSQINEIKELPEEPEAIFLTSYLPGEASAMKQIRAAGLNMPILSEEDIDGDAWKGAVPNLSDVYFAVEGSIFGDDPDPKINEVVARYEKETGKQAEFGTLLTGYATIDAIAEAIEGAEGSTEGTALQEQLEGFKEKPLILETTFDEEHHITIGRTLRVMQIQNGKTTFVKTWKPKVTPIGE